MTDQEIIPQEGTSEGGEQSSLIEVNGQKMSADELKKAYENIHSDYTKKTQRLSELEKAQQSQPQSQYQLNEQALSSRMDEEMKRKWYVKKDDIEAVKKETAREYQFNEFLRSNPELNDKRDMIDKLAKADGIAPEDVVERYKLMDAKKLQKAKTSSAMIGSADRSETPKIDFSNMAPGQREKYKADNAEKFSGNKFSKVKNINR